MSNSWWWILAYQNFPFRLEAQIFILATNIVTCFPWCNRLILFILRRIYTECFIWNDCCLPVCHFSNTKWCFHVSVLVGVGSSLLFLFICKNSICPSPPGLKIASASRHLPHGFLWYLITSLFKVSLAKQRFHFCCGYDGSARLWPQWGFISYSPCLSSA